MTFIQVSFKHILLQIRKLLIIQIPIIILIRNPKNSLQRPYKRRGQLLLLRVINRVNRKQHHSLGAKYQIDQLQVVLRTALNAHLHKLKLSHDLSQKLLELSLVKVRPLVYLVPDKDHWHFHID